MKIQIIRALLLALIAPTAALADINIPLSNATAGSTFSAAYAAVNAINDPFSYSPNNPLSSAPIQTNGSGVLFLSKNTDAGNFWQTNISVPSGSTLDFLDVWGRRDPLSEVSRHRSLTITLSDGTNTWTSPVWSSVTSPTETPPSYGRFDFSTAGVTNNLRATATSIRIDHTPGNTDYLLLAEVRAGARTDPSLVVPAAFNFGMVSRAVTTQKVVPVSNWISSTLALNISAVSVSGFDASFFTVNSFPSSLAAGGGAGSVSLTFDPQGFDGPFDATLEITSDIGGVPGTVTQVLLSATAVEDPFLVAPAASQFARILPSSTSQKIIPVSNSGPEQNLAISGVTVSGVDAARFTVNSFPTSLAANGGADSITVTFDPNGAAGPFSATLDITSNQGGVPGTVTTVSLSAYADLLAVLSTPAITASAQAFNNTFVAGNLFDSTIAAYASATRGAGPAFSKTLGTWIELDFGQPVTMNRMILVSRINGTDLIGEARLILSEDSIFDETDTIYTFNSNTSFGQGKIESFPSTTARYARYEVVTSLGIRENLGGTELRFLNTPTGSFVAPVTVIGGSTPLDANFALANAANGDAGVGGVNAPNTAYASLAAAENMFVDFDLGVSVPVVGFDFFDRLPATDRVTQFNLLLSDDPAFATGVTTLSFSPGSTVWGIRRFFTGVSARYIRFQATSVVGSNTGMSEIIFYTSTPTTSATPYENFITATWGLTGGNAAPNFDFDRDGLANAIEFLLGGNPTVADLGLAPTSSVSSTNLVFTFRRSDLSASDTSFVEYGSDLLGWTEAKAGIDGVSIVVVDDGFGAGVDSVEVSIPRTLGIGGRLFARLRVGVAVSP